MRDPREDSSFSIFLIFIIVLLVGLGLGIAGSRFLNDPEFRALLAPWQTLITGGLAVVAAFIALAAATSATTATSVAAHARRDADAEDARDAVALALRAEILVLLDGLDRRRELLFSLEIADDSRPTFAAPLTPLPDTVVFDGNVGNLRLLDAADSEHVVRFYARFRAFSHEFGTTAGRSPGRMAQLGRTAWLTAIDDLTEMGKILSDRLLEIADRRRPGREASDP